MQNILKSGTSIALTALECCQQKTIVMEAALERNIITGPSSLPSFFSVSNIRSTANQPDNIQVSAKPKKKKTKKQKEREGKDELMRTMSNTSAKYQLALEGAAVVVQKNQVKKNKKLNRNEVSAEGKNKRKV